MTTHRIAAIFKRAAFKVGVAAGVAVALLAVAPGAAAQPRPAQHEEQPAVETFRPAQREQFMPAQRGGGVSLAQASSMAQAAFPGTVVGARTVQMGDRVVHEIRIRSEDGTTVRTFRIDARTGAFL